MSSMMQHGSRQKKGQNYVSKHVFHLPQHESYICKMSPHLRVCYLSETNESQIDFTFR